MSIETSFEGYLRAKEGGHLRSMKISHRGAVSVDSAELVRSRKVKSNVRALRRSLDRRDSKPE
ncbi:hypothetical protein [Halomonas litopenaei]|uniref:hypothetical protein n=1 Tax=Halomonas litopenaei TaxID=2109328 RepID=UPI003FA0FF86